ncbi:hypothetical protein [Candidatus Acidianus copahuensis]|uniref:hypothetical protein n=1 Tax=Candidatus Acidianus copahuensis TaxID=1160895 RepID=UPI00123767C1|nr:hypothetical protein [Candidatus Acidianus copahuensis]
MRLFIIITSALLSIISVFLSPQFTLFTFIPLLLCLFKIRLKPVITSAILLVSLPLENWIVYGTALELALLSSW